MEWVCLIISSSNVVVLWHSVTNRSDFPFVNPNTMPHMRLCMKDMYVYMYTYVFVYVFVYMYVCAYVCLGWYVCRFMLIPKVNVGCLPQLLSMLFLTQVFHQTQISIMSLDWLASKTEESFCLCWSYRQTPRFEMIIVIPNSSCLSRKQCYQLSNLPISTQEN